MTKLIAGKRQDGQPVSEPVDKLVHLGVIPGGRASQRGHVFDENHAAPILR